MAAFKPSIRLVLSLLLTLSSCTSVSPESTEQISKESPPPRNRVLLIGLDGVGFETFRKLQNGGHFRDFKPAAQMVATFPSISDPNWSRLLRYPVEQSYTKEHFDRLFKPQNGGFGRIIGGLVDQIQTPPHYEAFFDFKPEGLIEHFASLAWNVTSSLYWLSALEREFFKSDPSRDYAAYILNTDMIAHTKGEKSTLEFLGLLEERIKKIRKRYLQERKQDLEVILLSDHGNAFFTPRLIFPTEDLQKRGWKVTESISAPDQVAFVFPEILSFAAMYCEDNSREKLSRDIAKLEGIHSAFYLSAPNTITFQSNEGITRAVIDPKKKTVRYQVLSGKDPYEQIQFFKKNIAIGWDDYFDLTADTPYPNALVRAWESFYVNSEQAASVLVNPKLGYVFANRALHFLTKFFGLTSVHGSMHRDEALGMVVSTHRSFTAIRPHDFMDRVQLKR